MSLNQPSGNMYIWAFTWNVLMGICPHVCSYCYVSKSIAPMLKKWGNEKYYGKLRLDEKALKDRLTIDNKFVVFVQSCGDLFAEDVPSKWILRVLEHCKKYPDTTFLFQTKNPARFQEFQNDFPPKFILGTTLETNKSELADPLTKAPGINKRFVAMLNLPGYVRKMISVEPVIDFDVAEFTQMIDYIKPEFVSIGADSKNCGLQEPSKEKIKKFIENLEYFQMEVRLKDNLKRLRG